MEAEIKFRYTLKEQIPIFGNFRRTEVLTLKQLEAGEFKERIGTAEVIQVSRFIHKKDRNGTDIYEHDDVVDLTHHKDGAVYRVVHGALGFHGLSSEGDKYGAYTLNLYTGGNQELEVVGTKPNFRAMVTPDKLYPVEINHQNAMLLGKDLTESQMRKLFLNGLLEKKDSENTNPEMLL